MNLIFITTIAICYIIINLLLLKIKKIFEGNIYPSELVQVHRVFFLKVVCVYRYLVLIKPFQVEIRYFGRIVQ